MLLDIPCPEGVQQVRSMQARVRQIYINRDYGNSMVPMLIGDQGFKKSCFCKAILPSSMREYYMNSPPIKLGQNRPK